MRIFSSPARYVAVVRRLCTANGPDTLVVRRNKPNNSTTLSDYFRVFTIRGNITVNLSGMAIENGFAKLLHPHSSTERR